MITVRVAGWTDLPRLLALPAGAGGSLPQLVVRLLRRDVLQLVAQQGDSLIAGMHIRRVQRGQRGGFHAAAAWVSNSLWGSHTLEPDELFSPLAYGVIGHLPPCDDRFREQDVIRLLTLGRAWLNRQGTDALHVSVDPADTITTDLLSRLGFQPLQIFVRRTLDQTDLAQPSLSIRSATTDDIPQLIPLVRQEILAQERTAGLFQLQPAIDWERWVYRRLHHPNVTYLVATEDDRLVGYAELRMVQPGRRTSVGRLMRRVLRTTQTPYHPSARIGIVEEIYVAPEFRRLGVAKTLLIQINHWFAVHDVDEIRAAIWADNKPSLALSRARGFVPIRMVMRQG